MSKLLFAAVAAAASTLFLAVPSADAQVFTGDTTDGPTFNRPFTLSNLSAFATDVPYEAVDYVVSADGDYVLTMTQVDDFDTYLLFYSSFDPADPLANLIVGDDDLVFGVSSQIGAGNSSFGADPLTLVSGTSYTVVTTGFGNDDFGAYTLEFAGPGVAAPAVPEPASLGLLSVAGLGLLRRRRR